VSPATIFTFASFADLEILFRILSKSEIGKPSSRIKLTVK